MRNLLGKRRGVVLVGTVCAALGVGSTLLMQQAQASSGSATPNIPKVQAHPNPTFHATTANGQAAPTVTATNAHCGQIVTASLTLNGDLNCPTGTALTVSGTSVVLNLNGHEILGGGISAGGTGVDEAGKNSTVENGVVTNFNVGIEDSGITDTLTKLRLSDNNYGIYEHGSGNKMTSNEVFASQSYGIVSFGPSAVFTSNRLASNGLNGGGYSGIQAEGPKATLTSNAVNGTHGGSGIQVTGLGSTLTSNTANFNQYDGIDVYDAGVIDGGGNTAKGNNWATGTNPVQCYSIVCN